LQHELATLETKRKETPHHITTDELPEEARFLQLSTHSKQLVDTIKMIAYRAETAMANSLREHLKRPGEARRLLSSLYTTEADLLPDQEAGTLTVRLHHSAKAATDRAIERLCEELNATETVFRARICAPRRSWGQGKFPEVRFSDTTIGHIGDGHGPVSGSRCGFGDQRALKESTVESELLHVCLNGRLDGGSDLTARTFRFALHTSHRVFDSMRRKLS